MDEKVKKILIIVGTAVAVVAAGVVIMKSMKTASGELEAGVTHPSPAKSMAEIEREAVNG